MGGREAGERTVLKADVFGRVELRRGPEGTVICRIASGSRIPGTRWIARMLLARERRALRALGDFDGVPQLASDGPGSDGGPTLVRSYLAGEPLSRARALPADYFDHLAALVRAMHARGVCHNDLHKEQNVLVRPDGRPALIDFQLASVHPRGGRAFRVRCREDLRHVEKHRQRYVRQGRSRAEAGLAPLPRRGLLSRTWRRLGKPLYHLVTRGLFRWRDGEERRSSSGPWPRWDPPLGR